MPPTERERFERTVLPHLRAAYNLARWLTRNGQDAEDVVQEAYLRAMRFFAGRWLHGKTGPALEAFMALCSSAPTRFSRSLGASK